VSNGLDQSLACRAAFCRPIRNAQMIAAVICLRRSILTSFLRHGCSNEAQQRSAATLSRLGDSASTN